MRTSDKPSSYIRRSALSRYFTWRYIVNHKQKVNILHHPDADQHSIVLRSGGDILPIQWRYGTGQRHRIVPGLQLCHSRTDDVQVLFDQAPSDPGRKVPASGPQHIHTPDDWLAHRHSVDHAHCGPLGQRR